MYKTKKRVSKEIIKKEDLDFLFNITESDVTLSFIMETFGEFNGKSRFNPYDIIEIPKDTYFILKNNKKIGNKNTFKTTVGKWIFNKYFIEADPQLTKVITYVNEDINKKVFEKIDEAFTFAYIEDIIPLESYKKYIMKTQQFMPFVSILSPSYSDSMLTITTEINKRKEKLLKDNEKAIEDGDIYVIDKISKELLDYSKELLKDDPAMDCFNSGAIGSFENNFKNIYVMRGSVKDPDPIKGYNIITSNFIDGVKKEDYPKLANTLAAGPYARSKKTEKGGYWEKLFTYAFGHVTLLDEGSDCGTKRTISVQVTEQNIKDIIYSYAVNSNGTLTEITYENRHKFIGKNIKIRFSSMCEAKDGICSKCAGTLFYRLGIKNIGMSTQQIPSRLKVLSMKLFHDSQTSFIELGKDVDPMKVFGLI